MTKPDRQAGDVRTGQGDVKRTREEFARRLGERFYDPAFDPLRAEIDRIIETAWVNYDEYHKSPRMRKAGPEFADPEFELPVEWLPASQPQCHCVTGLAPATRTMPWAR